MMNTITHHEKFVLIRENSWTKNYLKIIQL